ncbi:MAG TPA: hypothetical protein PLD20_22765 [Blastocatellia bacterium]|nr:hypothetical protein [Blastocatellia bacterium]HMV83233.1 hypothetical protein [Blastocatellia bacterium]HMX27053.1 hypothetical protein [Blastocatellia bacterium]HMY72238.1 hypothetical protein [Blastocatellia bacterium]HMZ20774.1 hypothetical protein [Blastocatellia bacterium]
MPTTNGRNLTLITVDNNVTVRVEYNAVFNSLERHLAANGLVFEERISVLGVDPPGTVTGTTLHYFPVQILPVIAGAGSQTIARNRSLTVSRASLQEDAGLGDDDEIRCRIEVRASGLPTTIADFTDQKILVG